MSCLDYFGVSHILIPGMLTNHLLSFLSCYGDEFFRNVIIQVFFLVVLISSTDENHMHCTEEAQQAETYLWLVVYFSLVKWFAFYALIILAGLGRGRCKI